MKQFLIQTESGSYYYFRLHTALIARGRVECKKLNATDFIKVHAVDTHKPEQWPKKIFINDVQPGQKIFLANGLVTSPIKHVFVLKQIM